MPSCFSSTTTRRSPKQNTAVFAGLDDPFNFPASKMRYNSRSSSRTSSPDSATDSGYGSVDDDTAMSVKSQVLPKNRRKLEKRNGHWRMNSYEYQSVDNDGMAEREPILVVRQPDDTHEWKPDPKRTFTDMERKATPTPTPRWFTSRVYGRAMLSREKSEGVTDLQRAMAPVIRHASPSPSPSLSKSSVRPSAGLRQRSTLLHPSPPIPSSTTIDVDVCPDTTRTARGRSPSTLLHPSPSRKPSPSLRSPRHRSPTPLGIPTSSAAQPTPTPLRIHLRKPSVLHSCFSDSESQSGSESESESEFKSVFEGEHGDDDNDEDATGEDEDGDGDDARSFSSLETAAGNKNGSILARTALVARAVRVRVGSPVFKKEIPISRE